MTCVFKNRFNSSDFDIWHKTLAVISYGNLAFDMYTKNAKPVHFSHVIPNPACLILCVTIPYTNCNKIIILHIFRCVSRKCLSKCVWAWLPRWGPVNFKYRGKFAYTSWSATWKTAGCQYVIVITSRRRLPSNWWWSSDDHTCNVLWSRWACFWPTSELDHSSLCRNRFHKWWWQRQNSAMVQASKK